jgi:hypothetical protein
MSCPTAETLTFDVRGPSEIAVTLGAAAPKAAGNASLDEGTLIGTFTGSAGTREAEYRFYLRAEGNRLAGPVTRRISLGPRANEVVTLWAQLERDPR